MSFLKLEELEVKEPVSGYKARFVHSEKMTLAYWTIKADAVLPEHSHFHEQVVNVTEGKFELIVNSEPYTLEPGSVYVIPPNIAHSGKAITDCRIIDVFCPVREDYR